MALATSALLALLASASSAAGLIFRSDQFKEVSPECKSSDGKPLTYILNEERPALYVSVDPYIRIKASGGAATRRRVDSASNKLFNLGETRLMHEVHYGDHRGHSGLGGGHGGIGGNSGRPLVPSNSTFDCVLQVQTQLPKGDKDRRQYDALSLVVIQLIYGSHPSPPEYIQISTFGHRSPQTRRVVKPAQYADRMWAAANPNFLLSGQLSGFDSIDYRTKVDLQHIIKPETLHSTFDKPASIKVNLTRWNSNSHVYLVFTSYKYLRGHHSGERCQEQKEFDCAPPSFLSSSADHLCMSQNLACDGLPNCGQDFLPNQDENCFKIHWSSILLSLVSYILLAITLLLCLSCFARVIIQWSVRSSIAEIRGGAGGGGSVGGGAGGMGGFASSPTGSFRSSSRFFSFLGNTFASRWERPPPTYDEAMKHVNPDLSRPQAPPAYTDAAEYGASASVTITTSQSRDLASMAVPPPSSSSTQGPTDDGATAAAQADQVQSSQQPTATSVRASGESPPPEYERHDTATMTASSPTTTTAGPSYMEIGTSLSPPPNLTLNFGAAAMGEDDVDGCRRPPHPSVVVLPPTPMEPHHPPMPPSSSSSKVPPAAAVANSKASTSRVVEAEICQTNL